MECNRRRPRPAQQEGPKVHAGARRGRSISPRDEGPGEARRTRRASWNDGGRGSGVVRVSCAAVLAIAAALAATAAPAQAGGEVGYTSTPVTGVPVTAAGAAASRLARTDASLLGRLSSAPVNVVVKLDYDALATYAGGVPGLAATSPAATGRRLDLASPAAQAYRGYAATIEDRFLSALTAAVPDARVGARLRIAYGGVALTVPQNRVVDLLRLPGVLAVQRDGLEHPLAASTARGHLATRSNGQMATAATLPGNGGRGVI